jgi:hypothetical protein
MRDITRSNISVTQGLYRKAAAHELTEAKNSRPTDSQIGNRPLQIHRGLIFYSSGVKALGAK